MNILSINNIILSVFLILLILIPKSHTNPDTKGTTEEKDVKSDATVAGSTVQEITAADGEKPITNNPADQLSTSSTNGIPETNTNKANANNPSPPKKIKALHKIFPQYIVDYFNDPEFPENDYFDSEGSYYKKWDNGSKLKQFEESQKFVPLVAEREKYKILGILYNPSFSLDVKQILLENPDGYNYYDWEFVLSKQERRFVRACPSKAEKVTEFPMNTIIKAMVAAEEKLEERNADVEEVDADSSDEDSTKPLINTQTSSSNPSSPTRDSSPSTKKSLKSNSFRDKIPTVKNSPTLAKFVSNMQNLVPRPTSPLHNQFKQPKPEQQTITLNNTFKGRKFKVDKTINQAKYDASSFPCKIEVKPSIVQEETVTDHEAYYIGYLVQLNEKATQLKNSENIEPVPISDKKLWFHVAHAMVDKHTRDAIAVFSYAPYHQHMRYMKDVPIFTDYTVNEFSDKNAEYYEEMYSFENQERVFTAIEPENWQQYLDPRPEKSLILVKQELMDQKSVATMAYKRAALDYMNTAPMYKIIKDTTWRRLENLVMRLPMASVNSMIMFVTGTYGELKINDKPVYLDRHNKRLKVPYAFYKVVHIKYKSPTLGEFCREYQMFSLSVVLVTHNNPFEKKLTKICKKSVLCESIGFKKVIQTDPKFGFTYCCPFTPEFATDLGIKRMYDCIPNTKLLDLRFLWFIERNQLTAPLNYDEKFELLDKEPPQYEEIEPEKSDSEMSNSEKPDSNKTDT